MIGLAIWSLYFLIVKFLLKFGLFIGNKRILLRIKNIILLYINYKNQFMKKKLLLFLLFHIFFGSTLSSKNLSNHVKLHDMNFDIYSKLISPDTIK